MRWFALAMILTGSTSATAQAQTLGPAVGAVLLPGAVDGEASDNRDTTLVAGVAGGKVDATSAIQAAIEKRGVVHLPCGTYRIDGTLVLNADGAGLVGDGPRCVVLTAGRATGDMIQVGDGVKRPANVSLKGVMLYAPMARTSGWAVHARRYDDLLMRDVLIGGSHWGGVQLAGVNTGGTGGAFGATLDHVQVQQTNTAPCIEVTDFAQDTYLTQVALGADLAANSCIIGLHVNDAGGVYGTALDIRAAAQQGILIDPMAARRQSVFAVQLTTVLSDTSTGDNVALTGDGPITELAMVNSWMSSSRRGNGFHVTNPATDGVVFTNTVMVGNALNGALVETGRNISFGSGVRATYNNSLANGTASGLVLNGGSFLSVVGAKSGSGGVMAAPISVQRAVNAKPNPQVYGLTVAAGVTHLLVQANQMDGNVSGGCKVAATGPSVHVSGNDGAGC